MQSSDRITDILIGFSDGLIIPFAITAGMSAAAFSSENILVVGLVTVCAGSIMLGLGGYFTGSNSYKEANTLEAIEEEKQKLRQFLVKLDLDRKVQDVATEDISRDENKWQEMVSEFYTRDRQPKQSRARKSGFNIALAYIAGGIISVAPYFIFKASAQAVVISAILTISSLLVFGFIKGKLTAVNPLISALRSGLAGGVAGGSAYAVMSLIM